MGFSYRMNAQHCCLGLRRCHDDTSMQNNPRFNLSLKKQCAFTLLTLYDTDVFVASHTYTSQLESIKSCVLVRVGVCVGVLGGGYTCHSEMSGQGSGSEQVKV